MNHAHYIHHCHALAERGRGMTGTNPMVGAVLVRPFDGAQGDNEIVAEGWHASFGEPHAERMLLESASSFDISRDDILYVNLEPCCHHGKTPPCADLILESGIKKVVFGMRDPSAEAGGGCEVLRSQDLEVVGPVNSVTCRRFNRGFISLHEQRRPWITLKQARTSDGRIANEDGSQLKITSEEQDEWSHTQLRAKHDAILVGVETIIRDDPQLNVRFMNKKVDQFNPLRIVLDPNLRIQNDAKILSKEMASGTMIITSGDSSEEAVKELQERGVRIVRVPVNDGVFDWSELWKKLTTPMDDFYGITSILVEGGGKTWEVFQKAKMVDEEIILIGN